MRAFCNKPAHRPATIRSSGDADPVPGAGTSDDQKLLLQKQPLGDDGASAARPHKTDGCYDQVNE